MIELRRRYSGSKGSDSPSFSRLPAGYQEVEWIQNTGGGYINLPFDRANIKFKFTVIPPLVHPNSMQMGYGGSAMVGFVKNFDNDFILCIVNGQSTGVSIPTNEKKIHEIEIRHSDFMFLIDGIDCNPNRNSFNNKSNFSIFKRNGYSIPDMCGKMYVLQMDIGNGYNDVYIPCYRISDRKPGMYDIVNDVFYTNAGEGEFSYGPDVHYNIPPEYQEVEYLEGTGTQYIDTGVIPQQDTKIITEMFFPYQDGYGALFGSGNYAAGIPAFTLWNEQPFVVDWARQRYSVTNDFTDKKNRIIFGEGLLEINNKVVHQFDEFTFKCDKTLYLFTSSFNIEKSRKVKIYSFLIYQGERIMRNFIPCYRKSDNVEGMYDLVSGKFYTNAGTGKFTIGPLVI